MTHTGDMSDVDEAKASAEEQHAGHGHATGQPLGPVDVVTWAYALAGASVGVVLVLALLAASGG